MKIKIRIKINLQNKAIMTIVTVMAKALKIISHRTGKRDFKMQ